MKRNSPKSIVDRHFNQTNPTPWQILCSNVYYLQMPQGGAIPYGTNEELKTFSLPLNGLYTQDY